MIAFYHVWGTKRDLRIIFNISVHGSRGNRTTTESKFGTLKSEPLINWVVLLKLQKENELFIISYNKSFVFLKSG
jgi:hypothetical protein